MDSLTRSRILDVFGCFFTKWSNSFSNQIGAQGGLDPFGFKSQPIENQHSCKTHEIEFSHIASQNSGQICQELAKIIAIWPRLPHEFRNVNLAFIRIYERGVGD